MNFRKTLQVLAFSFIILSIIEKAVLQFLLIIKEVYTELYEKRSTKKATDIFQRRAP